MALLNDAIRGMVVLAPGWWATFALDSTTLVVLINAPIRCETGLLVLVAPVCWAIDSLMFETRVLLAVAPAWWATLMVNKYVLVAGDAPVWWASGTVTVDIWVRGSVGAPVRWARV